MTASDRMRFLERMLAAEDDTAPLEKAVDLIASGRDAQEARLLLRAFESLDEDAADHLHTFISVRLGGDEANADRQWLMGIAFAALVEDADPFVRAGAAELLAYVLWAGDKDPLVARLKTALNDPSDRVRQGAADALAYLQPRPLIDEIRERHEAWLADRESRF